MEVATRPSALAHDMSAWEFDGIAASAASPLAASSPARRSWEISAAARDYSMPAAHPSPPSAAHPRPPARCWLKPAGETCFKSCCVHRSSFNPVQSCLVHRDSSGALLVVAAEAIPSRLPPCRRSEGGRWGTLWRPPDSWSCPEEASASELAQEGFLFLWAVLFQCGLSCFCI